MLRIAHASRFGLNVALVTAKGTLRNTTQPSRKVLIRNYARPPRSGPPTSAKSTPKTLRERLMGPPTENAYSLGKGAAAGASAIGLGALCFYGLGAGNEANILNNSMAWPDYVRERVHATYFYFGASCLISAVSAVTVFRTPRLLQMVTQNGFMSVLGTFIVMIGSGALAQSLEYQPGLGVKQIAWAVHCAIMGAVIAPICFIGGPVLTRAALYTVGVVGGLSAVAVCAPSDQFLFLGGPLAIGLGLVFAASLASMWLPPTTMVGAGAASFSLYGGLIVFAGFLLFDTQRIVRMAEEYPTLFPRPFDPINASMSIYMDTLNIFIRLAIILAGNSGSGGGSGGQKKR